jgi:solute carrier family 25 uncoupling protein 8/9
MPSPRADGTAPWVTPWQREWLSASLGCAVADTIFNPLEVLKVRRQVAMGSAGASVSAVPASTIALARAAIKDKGVYRGLWHPGLEATIYRAFSYTGFRIGMYPAVRDAVVETRVFGDSDSIAARVVAGAGTGRDRLGAV